MKVLTICQGGSVRSAAAAYQLKCLGHDAIAASSVWTRPQTMKMLSDWADHILVMRPEFMLVVPLDQRHKAAIIDVGEDVWGNPFHKELLTILQPKIISWLKDLKSNPPR